MDHARLKLRLGAPLLTYGLLATSPYRLPLTPDRLTPYRLPLTRRSDLLHRGQLIF